MVYRGTYNEKRFLQVLVATFILTSSTISMANASPSNSGFITNSFSKGDKSTYVDFESTKDKNKSDNAELYYEFKQGNISKDYYLQKSKNLSSDEYEKEFILSANTFLDESIERSNEQLSNAYLEKIKNTGNYTNVNLFSRAASGMIETLLQVPQERDYYCGPSTAKSIISSRSSNPSQKTLAHKDWLETDVWGNTPWWVGGNADGYNPMQYTLNKYQGINYYSIYGSSVTASGLKSKVVYSIDRGYGIAADIWEVPGGSYLPGHPAGYEIFHWVPIDGYYNYGDTIHYAEPIYNASSVSWYQNIKNPYYNVSLSTMANVTDVRGIVW